MPIYMYIATIHEVRGSGDTSLNLGVVEMLNKNGN